MGAAHLARGTAALNASARKHIAAYQNMDMRIGIARSRYKRRVSYRRAARHQ